MKGNIQVPKGTRDFTSKVMFRRNYIFRKVKSCFERYGYAPIETPAMENIEIEEILKERILNHFRGVFYKAMEEGTLLQILESAQTVSPAKFELPEKMIRTNFIPFESLLPLSFVDKCIQEMKPYIKEANITLELHDDTFKFIGLLPGVIIKSNADSIFNDTLWWAFTADSFLNDDYMIEAASVIYHPKRIQLTIVVISVMLLLILSIKYIKRKSA